MTLYRFHGRITVEREESLSHLLYERMSIMYKVELKFDTSKLAPETVNQMCEQADQIFEQEDLSCAVKCSMECCFASFIFYIFQEFLTTVLIDCSVFI